MRMSGWDRDALRVRWRMLVLEAMRRHGAADDIHITTMVTVRVTRTGRLMDWDNMGASMKPIFDALVCWKVLDGDSPKYIAGVELRQVKASGKASMTVELFTSAP
jgi:hypothetical protein